MCVFLCFLDRPAEKLNFSWVFFPNTHFRQRKNVSSPALANRDKPMPTRETCCNTNTMY